MVSSTDFKKGQLYFMLFELNITNETKTCVILNKVDQRLVGLVHEGKQGFFINLVFELTN